MACLVLGRSGSLSVISESLPSRPLALNIPPAHFNWGGSLALGVDRFRGALHGIARNMGNRGADAPTGTSEPIRLGRSVDTSTASIRTSGGNPLRSLRASQHGHYRHFLDQAIYILSSVTPHAPLATLIRRGNATTKKCSVVGGSRNPMILTSERRRIEDLIATVSYAEFRRDLGPECQLR